MMDVLGESAFCRLCAEIKNDFLRIYDEEGYKLAIGVKINKYLQIQVDEKDSLPKNVCWECYSKLEQCFNFVTNSQNAQITLSQKVFSAYTDDSSMKEEGLFSTDALFHQSNDLINFGDQQMEKNDDTSGTFQCTNLTLSNPNTDCYFNKPADCLFEERNRSIVSMPHVAEDINTNNNIIDCSQTTYVLRKKDKKKNSVEDDKILTNNLPMPRYKRKPTRKKKSLSLKKKFDSCNLSDEDDYDEMDSISLREKYFNNIPWLCTECEENFQTMKELQFHQENYHVQSLKYMCPYCYKVYLQYHGFVAHLEKHQCSSEFVCDQCSKTFSSKKLLENHLSTHSGTRQYQCRDCGKSFRHQTGLSAHNRCHLSDHVKAEYACDQCDKVFSTKPNLVTHKKIHIGLRNYICDLCGKGFVQKGNLCAHMLTHSDNKPFTCDICNKEFKTRMQLRKHKSVHTGKKPHQCDTCGRMFRERATLKEHYRIHTGAMPFSCEFCGKAFRFKGVLTTHRRQHTGERPYSCTECQHHFTNWPNYNKHMKRRHGIDKSRANCIKTDSAVLNHNDRAADEIIDRNVGSTLELPSFEDTLSPVHLDADKSVQLFEDPPTAEQLSSSFLISHTGYNDVGANQQQNTLLSAYYNMSTLQVLSSANQVIDMMNATMHSEFL